MTENNKLRRGGEWYQVDDIDPTDEEINDITMGVDWGKVKDAYEEWETDASVGVYRGSFTRRRPSSNSSRSRRFERGSDDEHQSRTRTKRDRRPRGRTE